MQTTKKLSFGYLLAVPLAGFLIAFTVGRSSYLIYLPLWIINAAIMTRSAWVLGLHNVKTGTEEAKATAKGAFSLIIPFILISWFVGIGPPPETAGEWVDTAIEQQARYFTLVVAGFFLAVGFAVFRDKLKDHGEQFYSLAGWIAISIALPLFVINMLYWGFYLPELFTFMVDNGLENRPAWFAPVRVWFGLISAVEVALTYVATASFAVSFKIAGQMSKTACLAYVLFSLVAFMIITLSPFFEETLMIPAFAVSIPAVPFIMPYVMGINALRKL